MSRPRPGPSHGAEGENRLFTRPDLSVSDIFLKDSPLPRVEDQSKAMRRQSALRVQRSIQLLDEAVGSTPGSSLRPGTHRTPSNRMNVSTPGKSLNLSGLSYRSDTSILPGKSLLATPGRRSFMADASCRDMSEFDAAGTTNVLVLQEEDPGLAASAGLYGDFMQSMKNFSSPHQVFDLLSDYETLCSDQTALLTKLGKRTVPGRTKFSHIINTMNHLKEEKSTWALLYSLYTDKHDIESRGDEAEEMMIDSVGKYTSDKQIVEALYSRDTVTRQAQIVVDWLEKKAEESLENFYSQVEFFTDKSGAWENTLHYLRQTQGGVPSSSHRQIVTEMDPDAPVRENKPLADLDREDEDRLFKYLFAFWRAGQLDEAQKLCTRCGLAWQAAALEGWRLYHDPNYDGYGADGEVQPVEGNPYRDVWRKICWGMAEEEKFHPEERAMYASFCGHLRQLLKSCKSWEDYVWAYFKVLIDIRVDREIRLNTTVSRTLETLPDTYMDQVSDFSAVFKEIEASHNEVVRKQSQDSYHSIQKLVILGEMDELMEYMYLLCKSPHSSPPPHLVRFMAHIVLFLRMVGYDAKEEYAVTILEVYVQHLINEEYDSLIATYVSTLPYSAQIVWYAKYLEGIQDKEKRQAALQMAEDADLDIATITKTVVENIRNKGPVQFSTDNKTELEASTSEEDRVKIEAIDWLVFDPSQRAEALRQANAVMRGFLALKKHAAAREVFNKIPPGSIEVITRNWQMQTGTAELPAEDENAIREYLCIQAFLDANDSFNDWFAHYHNTKPSKPDVPHGANFTEMIAYEHKVKQYEAELDRWNNAVDGYTKMAVDRIYNVLLFVDGGWMVDVRKLDKETQADLTRLHHLSLLRQLCIPPLVFLLVTVLHTTGQYREVLEVANILSSEQHKLYLTFRQDEIRKFLGMCTEASRKLLDQNCDPMGYKY